MSAHTGRKWPLVASTHSVARIHPLDVLRVGKLGAIRIDLGVAHTAVALGGSRRPWHRVAPCHALCPLRLEVAEQTINKALNLLPRPRRQLKGVSAQPGKRGEKGGGGE